MVLLYYTIMELLLDNHGNIILLDNHGIINRQAWFYNTPIIELLLDHHGVIIIRQSWNYY